MFRKPVNLLEAKPEEFKEFLNSFDRIISDCDGVLWSGTPIEGSDQFLELMKKCGKTINYASNNSIRSKENYERLFQSVGIENGFENLTVPSMAIAEYLKSVNFDKNKYIYSVSCSETVKVLESHGFKCKTGPDLGPEYYGEYIKFFEDDEEIGAVVFDSDIRINLPKIYKATAYLKRPEVLFLAGATDRYWPIKNGFLSLGCGAFTDMVIEMVKRKPTVLAKPGALYGELVMRKFGITDPSRVLFIGDMIEQDMGLGKMCGFKTLLVLTNHKEEEALTSPLAPDYYATSLGSLVPLLQKHCPRNKENGINNFK